MTGIPVTTSSDTARTTAMSALDRAVMIASRGERNFGPERVTVALHTAEGSVAIDGYPHGPWIPAPGWPELSLLTYVFDPADLEEFLSLFTEALDRDTIRTGERLIVAVHATVPGYDFDDAYAWRYNPHTKDFQAVAPTDVADLFHEDTTVLAYPWHKAPYTDASALAPAGPTA